MKDARRLYGRVDGIVLPELAVTPQDFDAMQSAVFDDVNELLISGVAVPPSPDVHGSNYAHVCVVAEDNEDESLFLEFKQHKHHRWYLEDFQVRRYGLASILDPGMYWWESTRLQHRELTFMALKPWLTLSVLICEDLARPDPVGDIVRAVGPNLVIALLMDGPQIAGRWSERCAAVLADDPGCSVLTLTSIGMASLSQPPAGKSASRVVALWKDREGLQQIELPEGHDALLLSLSNRYVEEWTADGRGDGTRAATIRLAGVFPIKSPI